MYIIYTGSVRPLKIIIFGAVQIYMIQKNN